LKNPRFRRHVEWPKNWDRGRTAKAFPPKAGPPRKGQRRVEKHWLGKLGGGGVAGAKKNKKKCGH